MKRVLSLSEGGRRLHNKCYYSVPLLIGEHAEWHIPRRRDIRYDRMVWHPSGLGNRQEQVDLGGRRRVRASERPVYAQEDPTAQLDGIIFHKRSDSTRRAVADVNMTKQMLTEPS